MRAASILPLILVLFGVPVTRADFDGVNKSISGTVVSADDERIIIDAKPKQTVTLRSDSSVVKDGQPVELNEIKIGDAGRFVISENLELVRARIKSKEVIEEEVKKLQNERIAKEIEEKLDATFQTAHQASLKDVIEYPEEYDEKMFVIRETWLSGDVGREKS